MWLIGLLMEFGNGNKKTHLRGGFNFIENQNTIKQALLFLI
ncbi:MAG: hypothetical protein ACI83W_000355 [Marinoscillum sp.]|jgi:hypothetical protein